MKTDDYFLTHFSCLVAHSKDLGLRLNEFKELNAAFEAEKVRIASKISSSIVTLNGDEMALYPYLKSIRAEKITALHFVQVEQANPSDLPEHIVAAFMNGNEQFLVIETQAAKHFYAFSTQAAPPYAITALQVFELIEAQEKKEQLWDNVIASINEALTLNQLDTIDRKHIRDYFTDCPPYFMYSFIDSLLKTAQETALALDIHFTVPPSLLPTLKKITPLPRLMFEENSTFYPYFYLTKTLPQGAQFLVLIAAQSFAPELWNFLSQTNPISFQDNSRWTANQWQEKLAVLPTFSVAAAQELVDKIRTFLTDKKIQIIIPDSLKEFFGPDAFELKLIAARTTMQHQDYWGLQPNPSPFTNYLFAECAPFPGVSLEPVRFVDSKDFTQRTISSLQKAAIFCDKINSPFAAAFHTGIWILTSDDFLVQTLSEATIDCIAQSYDKAQLNEPTKDYVLNCFRYSFAFQKYDLSEIQLRALITFSICDVFGGMGSYNDQYMSNEDDQKEFDQISTELYAAIRKMLAFAIQYPTTLTQ